MTNLQFLADMNISPLTVAALHSEGWDVIRVSDIMPRTSPDEDILERAYENGFVIISQDLDFSQLVALSGRGKPSLITVRLTDSAPNVVTNRLLEVLPQIVTLLEEGYAITIEDNNFRTRQLPIKRS